MVFGIWYLVVGSFFYSFFTFIYIHNQMNLYTKYYLPNTINQFNFKGIK